MTSDDFERGIQVERQRCLELLEVYRPNFNESQDKFMGSMWCRLFNQINNGVSPHGAAFGPHSFFEELEEFEDLDNLEDTEQ
jgi:hypothetical protein